MRQHTDEYPNLNAPICHKKAVRGGFLKTKILYSLLLTLFLSGCESTVTRTNLTQTKDTQAIEKSDQRGPTPPTIIRRINPTYPKELQKKKIIGEAVIEMVVLPDGTPTKLKIHSATHEAFGTSSLRAARNLVFEPAKIDGIPVSSKILVPFTFDPRINHNS